MIAAKIGFGKTHIFAVFGAPEPWIVLFVVLARAQVHPDDLGLALEICRNRRRTVHGVHGLTGCTRGAVRRVLATVRSAAARAERQTCRQEPGDDERSAKRS